MLETRLFYAKQISNTLSRKIGREFIDREDLKEIAKEFAKGIKSNAVICETSVDPTEGPVDPKDYRAWTSCVIDSSQIYYYIWINTNGPKDYALWFTTAHEIGHFLIHRGIMQIVGLEKISAELEEQADFFARMCFWPMERLVFAMATGFDLTKNYKKIMSAKIKLNSSVSYSNKNKLTREEICRELTRFGLLVYKENGWENYITEPKMFKYANSFLHQYKRYL